MKFARYPPVLNWLSEPGSVDRTSALNIGVTALVGSFFSCPGVILRPRSGWPCAVSPGSRLVFFGWEKRNSSASPTQTPASSNSDLLLSRPSSRRLSTGFCRRMVFWKAATNASRQLPLPVSSGADSSLSTCRLGLPCSLPHSAWFAASRSVLIPKPMGARSDWKKANARGCYLGETRPGRDKGVNATHRTRIGPILDSITSTLCHARRPASGASTYLASELRVSTRPGAEACSIKIDASNPKVSS